MKRERRKRMNTKVDMPILKMEKEKDKKKGKKDPQVERTGRETRVCARPTITDRPAFIVKTTL